MARIWPEDLSDMEDPRYEEKYQRELDDAWETLQAFEKSAQKPIPQQCHACDVKYAGWSCPNCHAERPAFIALKAITKARALPEPFPTCPNYPQALCACGLTNQCIGGDAA